MSDSSIVLCTCGPFSSLSVVCECSPKLTRQYVHAHDQTYVVERVVERWTNETLAHAFDRWFIELREKVHLVCVSRVSGVCVFVVCVCILFFWVCGLWMQSWTNQITSDRTQPCRRKSDITLDQQDTWTCLYNVVWRQRPVSTLYRQNHLIQHVGHRFMNCFRTVFMYIRSVCVCVLCLC
jgi:hypothetical protein